MPGEEVDERPLALTLPGPRGMRLHAVNAAAEERGVLSGMAHADARAILPSLACLPADPAADARALVRLARWCGRYSPWVSPDGRDGILIDASGCAHLFGGEAAMLEDIHARLARMGIDARVALADTPIAASAVARYGMAGGEKIKRVPPGETRAALAPLPVAALGIAEEAARTLVRLGCRRIGDLDALPRAALARRFGQAGATAARSVLSRLDRALGLTPDPLDPLLPVPNWRVRLDLAEPLREIADWGPILAPLYAEPAPDAAGLYR